MQLNPTQDRIEAIDALRGFALAGIVLVHMLDQYFAGVPPTALQEMNNPSVLDQIIQALVGLFFTGKFFALFSILFGLSYYIQMKRGADKGIDFKGRYLWRIVLLFIIGYIHSLFYRGDILTIYAVVALFLIPLYKLDNKLLLAIAIILFLGAGRYAYFIGFGEASLFGFDSSNFDFPENLKYFEVIQNGSLLEVFQQNAIFGMQSKIDFQVGVFGSRAYLTLGYFILGLWLGKIGLFEKFTESKKKIRETMYYLLGGIILAGAFTAFCFTSAGGNPFQDGFSWWSVLGMTGTDLFNLSLTGVLLCAFLLLYTKAAWQKFFNRFAPYGRTALTNYFVQSIIGTFIFFGWGLGMIGKLSPTINFGLAFVVVIIQMILSKWWLKNFKYGPLEWLWRSGTYFKWQAFKR